MAGGGPHFVGETPGSVTAGIDRVTVVPLKKAVTERGHLMEVQRCDDAHFPGFGQAYITATKPGVVRAWYLHHQQTDQIAVVRGEFLLVLYDARAKSPTRGVIQKIWMPASAPVLVQIPIGVWHGFRAEGPEEAYLLHLNTRPFDFGRPDEDRLAPDDPSIPHRWF